MSRMAVAEALLCLYAVSILSCAAQTVNYTTDATSTTFSLFTVGVTEPDDCICGCSLPNASGNIADEIAAIQEQLYLDTTTTSQYRRKKTSAEDKRPSAQGIGYSGILLLVGTFLFFFISDFINVIMYMDKKIVSVSKEADVASDDHD